MVEQYDLFATSNCDFEEEQRIKEKQRQKAMQLERLRQERQDFLTKNLNSRQHRLVDYLKDNFVSGKYFSIEELCSANLGYTLNTNPRIHDKCAMLGQDIRVINWTIANRYSIIIKDKKGGCKLCESETEFNAWRDEEKAKIDRKYQYLNNLVYKAKQDDTMPMLNLNDRVLNDNELEFLEVFKGER